MSEEKKLGFDNDLMRRGERHFDLLAFKELLHFASDVCLKSEPEYVDSKEPATTQEKIIQLLGVRGVSTAFDTIHLSETMMVESSSDEFNDAEFINFTSPLRNPLDFGGELDLGVQHNIQLFGEALLDEAYASLGTDVNEKVLQFQTATSDEEQMHILKWLMKRLNSFKKASIYDLHESDKDFFYHPIRLSPKILGQFPHNLYEPTCLGKSLLASSFFKKTGHDSLHGGVVRTRYESELIELADLLYIVKARGYDLNLTDVFQQRLTQKQIDLVSPLNDTGFHAVSLVKLHSGAWAVFDANFNRTYVIDKNTTIDQAFDDVYLSPTIPGIERTVDGISDGKIGSTFFRMLFDYMDSSYLSVDRISAMLQHASPDTLLNDIRSCVRDILAETKWTSDEIVNKLVESFLSGVLYDEKASELSDETGMLYEALERSIEAYFLWGESPESICSLMHRDKNYLSRRAEDVAQLPYIVFLNMALIFNDFGPEVDDAFYRHHTLELGSPAYRIGAAVLSDFSAYTDANISRSFWMTHWPSKIAITEHTPNQNESHHRPLLLNSLFWLEQALPYYAQHGILYEFVSDTRRENER